MNSKYLKSYIATVIICLIITSCGKLDLSNRGEHIFKDAETITPDLAVLGISVNLSEPFSIPSWPASDFYSEVGAMNHAFSGEYKVTHLLPLRSWYYYISHSKESTSPFVDFFARLFVGRYKKVTLIRPVYFDSIVIVSNYAGVISAFDSENGYKTVWELPIRKYVGKNLKNLEQVSVSYGADQVYITTNTGAIVCIDAHSGKMIWQRQYDFPVRSPVKYSMGKLYGVSSTNDFFVLDATSGDEILQRSNIRPNNMASKNKPSVLIGNQSAIVGYTTGDIVAFDFDTLDIRWIHDLSNSAVSGLFSMSDVEYIPAFVDGMIIAGCMNGSLYLIREQDGAIGWVRNISIASQIAVDGEFAFFVDSQSNLIAIHWPSGNIKWASKLEDSSKESIVRYLNEGDKYLIDRVSKKGPLIINGEIVVFTSRGRIFIFDAQNGNLSDVLYIPYYIEQPIVVDKTIYAISAERGELAVIK